MILIHVLGYLQSINPVKHFLGKSSFFDNRQHAGLAFLGASFLSISLFPTFFFPALSFFALQRGCGLNEEWCEEKVGLDGEGLILFGTLASSPLQSHDPI